MTEPERKKGDLLHAWISAGGADLKDNSSWTIVSWVAWGIGFGEITITGEPHSTDEPAQTTKLRTETMGKDFVKKVLNKLVDDAEVID